MSHTVVTADATLIKKIRNQMFIIGLLTVIIIGMVFYFFYAKSVTLPDASTKTVKFVQEVSDEEADIGIDNYKVVAKYSDIHASKGVLFDSAQIRRYLDSVYPKILERHRVHRGALQIPAGYQWKLAFYWMVRDDGTDIKKLGLYVVPVLYSQSNKDVKDYFKVTHNAFYHHPSLGIPQKNVYDEGHLWP